jgi:hypothetical protein
VIFFNTVLLIASTPDVFFGLIFELISAKSLQLMKWFGRRRGWVKMV